MQADIGTLIIVDVDRDFGASAVKCLPDGNL